MSNGKPNPTTGVKNRSGENFINRKASVPNLPHTPTLPVVEPYNVGAPGVMTARDLWNQRLSNGGYNRIAPLNTREIYSGDRYSKTIPGTDYEEMHAQQQSSFDKWSNATAKMLGTASTTFVSGTAGLLYGAGSALINWRLSDVVDNPITRGMDDISMGMNDRLPNYYTEKETNAEWWAPDNVLTANFWSDKVLKNLGFSLGAMGGGLAWASLFRKIGMTNALVRWGKGNDLATAVEKRLATAPAAGRYPAFEAALNETWTLSKGGLAAVAKRSDRILTSLMMTSGEATIEGLQTMNELKISLLDDFKMKHGRMPSDLELKAIKKTVQSAGLYVYGMNGLILTATNYIQLGKIIGSSRKADKALINGVRKNADTKLWEAAIPKTIPGKVLGVTKHIGRLAFAPIEGLEEGLQFAAQTGVEDYFSRAYENKNETLDLLTAVDDQMQNVYSNAYLHGLHETLTTKEGLESMLIGAFSGGLQQMGLVGSYRNEKGEVKYGIGKSGEIGEYGWTGRGGTRGKNTAQAVTDLNMLNVEQALKDGVEFMGIGIGSQKLRQDAINNDDLVAEKDAEEDYALSYLMPRIKYGKYLSVVEELTNYKTQAINPIGFDELVTEGIANQKETSEDFVQRIDNLLESALNTNNLYSLLNDRYENARGPDGAILYTPEVIDKLVYSAAKIENYDRRIEELKVSLLSSRVDLSKINESVASDTKLTDQVIEEVAATADNVKITDSETFATNLLDYNELLLKRKKYAKEYKTIKETPLNYQRKAAADPPEDDDIEDATIDNNVTVPTSDGRERTYNPVHIFFLGNVLADQVVSGVNLSAPVVKILKMNDDGTIKILAQNGEKIDITADQLEKLNLGSVNKFKTNKKGEFYFDNWNTPFIFDFKENGGFKKGRIVYNENDDKMHFVYADVAGNTREIEVTNDQFGPKDGNAPQIQRESPANNFQAGVEERFLAAKDQRKDKKHEDKLKVLGEFIIEMNARQAELTKAIAARKKNIERTKKTLASLQEDLSKKKSKQAKVTYTAAGKKILANVRRTEKDLIALEKLETQSVEELNDIAATLVYVEDLIENIDTSSTDYNDFIAEIKVDRTNLIDLNKEAKDNIKDLKTLIEKVKDFISASKEVLNNLIGQLGEAFPDISNEGVLMNDATTVEDYFTDLSPFASNPGETEETLAFAGAILTGIQPKKAQLDKLEKELSKVEEALKKYDDGIIARGKVLHKFNERQEQWERTKAEEEVLSTSDEITQDILDSQDKSSTENEHFQEGYEYEKLKSNERVPTSGTAPVGSDGRPVGEYAERAQIFANKFHRWVDEGKEFRARVVTHYNEHLIMKGLTKSLAGQTGIDPRRIIVLVVTDKKGVPIDQNGAPITDETKLVSEGIYQTFPNPSLTNRGGKTMFRADTHPDERKRIRDIYQKGIDKLLPKIGELPTSAQSKLQKPKKLGASFGLIDYIEILSDKVDEKTGKTLIDYGASNAARSSVHSTNLVTDEELKGRDVIKVATNNDNLTRGTVTIKSPLGHVFLEAPGGYEKLYNKKNSKERAELIYDVLHQITANILNSPNKNAKEKKTQDLFDWLRSVVYWGVPMNQQTKELKDPSDGSVYYEVIGKGEGVASERKLRIGQASRFDFTPSSLEANRDSIILLLQNVWGNTHAPGVAKDMFDVAYREITAVNKDGSTEGVTWDSYQQYLLSSVTPSGGQRNLDDIPLKTKVRPINKEVEGDTNKQGIYFYLIDDSDYIDEAPAEEFIEKTEDKGQPPVKSPGYIFDGVVENIITLAGLGRAAVIMNMKEAVAEFHKRKGVVFSTMEETQQFTFALLNKGIITIALDEGVEGNLVEAGGATDSSAKSNAEMLVVNVLASQITEAANKEATKPEPEPTSEVTEETAPEVTEKFKLDGSDEVITIEGSDVHFTLKGGVIMDAMDEDPEVLVDETKKLELITSLINKGHLTVTPSQANLDKGEQLLGSTDKLITLLAVDILNKVRDQIGANDNEFDSETEEDDYTRIIAERHLEPFKDTNWEKEAEWMKKNFPNIPINRLQNVIQATNGRQAWGLYRQGAVYIYKNAEAGTIYHEVFHAVWDMFLSVGETKQIAREFRDRKGTYKDRFTRKTIKYSEATDHQMNEELAEEFRDKVLYDKKPMRKSKSWIRNAFNDLVNFFNKFFFGKEALNNADKLFTKMGNGDYAAYIPHEDTLRKAGESQIQNIEGVTIKEGDQLRTITNRIEGINAVQEHEIYEQMTFVAINKLFATNDGLFAMKDKLKITNLYQELKNNLLGTKTRKGIIERKQIAYSKATIKNSEHQTAVHKKIKDLNKLREAIENNWQTLKERHMASLEPYDITFDEEESMIIGDETINKSDSMDGNKIDSFRKSSGAVKLLLATLADFEKIDGELKLKQSSIGGATFEQSDKVYITLRNGLHDSIGMDDMLERLRDMADNETTGFHYDRLHNRLTRNLASNGTLMLLGGFWKMIKGQNPDVPIVYILDGEVVVADTELSNSSKQARYEMTQNIIAHIREDSENKAKLYKVEGGYYNPTDALKGVTLNSSDLGQYVRFLKAFGINFKLKDIKTLTDDQRATFRTATEGLLKDLQTRVDVVHWGPNEINSTKNLLLLGTIKGVTEHTIFESTYFNIGGERTQNFIGPNATSDLHHALRRINNKDDLRSTRYSYLLDDTFSKGSMIMKKLFNGNIRKRGTKDIFKTVYVGGTINENTNTRTQSSRLKYRDRIVQEMNLNLEGIYANLVPGDSELEWAIKMHSKKSPFITLSSVSRNEYQAIFKDYFIDEVNLARDNRIVAKDRNNKELRFFKDILNNYNSTAHDTIVNYPRKISALEIYEKHRTGIRAAVEKFIVQDTEETKALLEDYKIIRKTLQGYSHDFSIKDKLLDETMMDAHLKTLTVNYMIANIEQHKMLYSDPYQYADELKRIKNFNSPRQALMHGSKSIYKALHDVYNKNYKEEDLGYSNMNRDSFRTITLQDVWSAIDPKLAEQYPGYTDFKNKEGWQETDGAGMITMQAYRFFRLLAGNWTPNNEDQYSYDIEYQERVIAINKAKGTEKSRLNESFRAFKKTRKKHDQSTYTPIKPIVSGNKANGRGYNDLVLDKYALFPLPYRVFHQMDPSSNILEFTEKMRREKIDYAIYETGRKVGIEETFPLYVDGALNVKQPFQPEAEKIKDKSKLNPEDRTKRYVTNIPFSIMSLQTEVPSKTDNKVIQGSQITKLVTLDFMNGGVPIDFNPNDEQGNPIVSEDKNGRDTTDYDALAVAWINLGTEAAKEDASPIYKEIQHNRKLLKERIQLGYEDLLRKLGLIENEDNSYTVTDYDKLVGTIEKEIFKQQKNNNLIAAFQDVRDKKTLIESTPVYQQIRNVLYSLANGNVIRPKITGGSKVQMPSTLFESANDIRTAVIAGERYLHSNVLKYYEEGKVAEIMVGRWDNSPLSDEALLDTWYVKDADGNRTTELTTEGDHALKGIAFRTPTQKQNSIEAFVIKKFLPKEYGDSVVIPSAIVRKTGSDFDIDKLSIYLKNLIWDGKILRAVKFHGFQGETDAKREFKKVFHGLMESRIESAEKKKKKSVSLKALFESIADGTILLEDFNDARFIINTILENNNIGINDTEEIKEYFDQRIANGTERINDLTEKQFEENAANDFADKLYGQSIENEYIESLQRLVMHPLNFQNLIKPNSAEVMKTLTEHINKKMGRPEIKYNSPGLMLKRKFMTTLRQAFVGGKRAIGVAAVGQTNHAGNQLADSYIDTNFIGTGRISDEDEFWLNGMKSGVTAKPKDADIKFLEYNKKTVDGRIMASLSRVKNQAGEYISDIIGMFIDGYVDISAGPWIIQMGATLETAGTWLYLLKIGIPKETVAYFMNQPIITEYLFDLELEGKAWLYDKKRVQDLLDLYAGAKSNVSMIPSEEGLDAMMGKKRGQLKPVERTQQQFILKEFLKYSKQADHLFLVTQGTNFDTATLSDPFLIFKKTEQFKLAMKTIVSSAQKILDTSFLGYLKEAMDKIREAYSVILLTDKNDPNKTISPRQVLEQILLPYISMPDREFIALSQKVVADFFDWAVQTNTGLNKIIAEILLGNDTERSAAKQIMQFKEDIFGRDANVNLGIKAIEPKVDHPLYNNMILSSFILVPGAKKNVPDNIIIKAKDNKVYDQNQTINSFEEIKDYLNSLSTKSKYAGLYEKMVRLAIIQSGLSTSPISFSKLLPYEDFKNKYNSTLLELEANPTILDYANLNVFERGNWWKGKWVSTITKKVDINVRTGRSSSYSEDNVDIRLRKATQNNEIPKTVFISEGNPHATEAIVYRWSTWISDTERIKRAKTGNTSHLHSQLMRKVYYERGKEPIPLMQKHTSGTGKDYWGYVYVAINAWGDSFRGREFYDSVDGTNVKASVLDNGFEKVVETRDKATGKKISSGEVNDALIIKVLNRKIIYASDRAKELKEDANRETSTEATDIYQKLGDKTVSENVQIKAVFQQVGIKYAKSIGGVFSLRLKDSGTHFGNPYSNIVKSKGLIPTATTEESVEKYIDWVINSQNGRAQWVRKQLRSGLLKGKPIVYYKELGEPSHATALDYLINKHDWGITRSESFDSYNGGFENKGKGTPQGDGKDKAMRTVATASIVEFKTDKRASSSFTTLEEVGNENEYEYNDNRNVGASYVGTIPSGGGTVVNNYGKTTMLARNGALAGTSLASNTKEFISAAHKQGTVFVVGDMPNVDSQFIDYLQKIGAKFTVYHTGSESRIKVKGQVKVTPKESLSLRKPATVKSTRLTKADIEFAVSQAKAGVLTDNKKPGAERIDLGLSRSEIRAGEKALLSGKIKSVTATRVTRALKDAREKGYYEYMVGTGGSTDRVQVPIEEGNPDQLKMFDSLGNPIQETNWTEEDNKDDECKVPF